MVQNFEDVELTETIAPTTGWFHDIGIITCCNRVVPCFRNLRDVVFTAVIGLLSILCLSLIIALAVANSRPDQKASADLCLDTECMTASTFILSSLNQSADPCDDFWSYTCGGFADTHPRVLPEEDLTLLQLLSDRNNLKLMGLLETAYKTSDQSSVDWKLKTFFSTCRYGMNEKNRSGMPLIEKMIPKQSQKWDPAYLGGWIAIPGLFNKADWVNNKLFGSVLTAVQTSYRSSPFFGITVVDDILTVEALKPAEAYIPAIIPGGLTLDPVEYYRLPGVTGPKLQAYSKFISTVIRQLQVDMGNKDVDETQIQSVTDLIIGVEKKLAPITLALQWDPKNVNVSSLPNDVVDLQVMLRWYFENTINTSQIVKIQSNLYLQAVNKLMKDNLTAEEQNAYTIWKAVETAAQNLGYPYVQAYQEFQMVRTSNVQDLDARVDYCYEMAKKYFEDVLNSEYVTHFFPEKDVQVANSIVNNLKVQLKNQIDQYSWMKPNDKVIAKLKVDDITQHVGFPPSLYNHTQLSNKYAQLNLTEGNHFANLLSVFGLQRHLDTQKLKEPVDVAAWGNAIYKATYNYAPNVGELFIPAGILQMPVFDSHSPSSLNYGALGRYAGSYSVISYDYGQGAWFLPNYTLGLWWDQDTINGYQNGPYNCTCQLYQDKDYDPWMGVTTKVGYQSLGGVHMREMAGLKAAYNAMSKSDASNAKLPGLHRFSPEQMFFLSYAQTFCFSRSKATEEVRAMTGSSAANPEHLLLNTLMSQFKPFSDAFTCSSNSQLHYSSSCDSY